MGIVETEVVVGEGGQDLLGLLGLHLLGGGHGQDGKAHQLYVHRLDVFILIIIFQCNDRIG